MCEFSDETKEEVSKLVATLNDNPDYHVLLTSKTNNLHNQYNLEQLSEIEGY